MSPEKLFEMVDPNTAFNTVVIIIACAMMVAKVAPSFVKMLEAHRARANQYEDLITAQKSNADAIASLSASVQALNDKAGRDFVQLDKLWKITEAQQKYIDESLEERALLIESVLNIAKGLQELGANGPTKQVVSDITAYTTRKAHSASTVHGVADEVLRQHHQ